MMSFDKCAQLKVSRQYAPGTRGRKNTTDHFFFVGKCGIFFFNTLHFFNHNNVNKSQTLQRVARIDKDSAGKSTPFTRFFWGVKEGPLEA